MVDKLSSPVAIAFTWMLLHFLWQGSAIALFYWLLSGQRQFLAARRKPSGRVAARRKPSGEVRENTAQPEGSRDSARSRYAISLSMLGVMAICPLVTFALLYDPNSTIRHPTISKGEYEHSSANMSPEGQTNANQTAALAIAESISSNPSSKAIAANDSFASSAFIFFASTRSIVNESQPYLLLVWVLGVVFSGLRLAAGFFNIMWLRSGRTAIPTALARQSVLFARKLGLRVSRVFASSRIREAAVVGFWRPVVLLPTAWLASLPPEVLEAVIAHELAHIRRLDVWVNLMQRVLESLFLPSSGLVAVESGSTGT